MAFIGNQEGISIIHHHMFNGTDYTYRKTRMRIFIFFMDFDLWNIIESSFEKSSIPMNEWNDFQEDDFLFEC